jgi:hypothetical protein
VVQVRANDRTAALVALYTLFAGNPLLATMEAFRMIEAAITQVAQSGGKVLFTPKP